MTTTAVQATYTAISTDGRTYSTTTVTAAEQAAFGDFLADCFAAGVERFGSVDAFQNALAAATR